MLVKLSFFLHEFVWPSSMFFVCRMRRDSARSVITAALKVTWRVFAETEISRGWPRCLCVCFFIDRIFSDSHLIAFRPIVSPWNNTFTFSIFDFVSIVFTDACLLAHISQRSKVMKDFWHVAVLVVSILHSFDLSSNFFCNICFKNFFLDKPLKLRYIFDWQDSRSSSISSVSLNNTISSAIEPDVNRIFVRNFYLLCF